MTEITEQELTQAAIFDNHEMLSCLLEGECSEFIDKVDRRNRTPLYTAVSNNSKKCVRLLLENGANPNIPADETFTLMTPLHLAIEDGKLELIPLLLEYGADLNVPNADGLSPFQLAKMYEHVRPGTDVLDMLNKENDKRKRAFEISRQEFIQACIKEDVALMASILKASEHSFIQEKLFFEVEEGVATTYVEPEEGKMTALCLACKRRNKEMVELLLEKDADPYKLPSNGLSPVHIICTYNEPEILKILLKKNPELAALKSRDEDLPIHLAIKSGYMPMIKTLLEFEYPPKSKRKFQADDDEYCVSYSLPFDINFENARQHSPLYIASAFGYIEIVNYLLALEVEADFIPKNQGRSGKSQDSCPSLKPFKPVKISKDVNHPYIPLHVAVKNKHVGVVKMLLSCGANPNQFYMHSSTHQKISALFLACDNDDDVILCTLLSYGVEDIDKTVFYLAVKSHPNLIPYLLKYRTVKNPVTEHIINRSSMLLKHADNGAASRNSYFTPKKNGTKNGEDYKKLFPVTPVYCKWQELRLKDLAEEWLISAAFHHNQGMKSSDSALALHAITRIDLSGNQLAGEIPPYLFSLPSLHSLILSKNSLLAFPKEEDVVLDCPLLEEIKVDHNKIEFIPSFVFSFPALRYLSASSNSLNHVPMEVWTCISLAVLNLADNNLSELQEPSFSPRTPTRGTPVGKNTPTGSQRHSPSPSISTPSSFVSLRSISDMDTVYDLDVFLPERHEDSPKYASYWRMNLELRESEGHSKTHKRCLLELDLSHNQLTNIPHWLCCCTPYLEHLNLSNNKIEEVGSLSKLPQYLKTLDLSGNKIVELQPWELDVTEETCYGPRSGAKCPHQQHMKLERLDTLNLSANPQLKSFIVSRMQISKRWSISSSSSLASLPVASEDLSQRLLFPNLTSLDLSQNLVLQSIPSDIGGLVHLKRLSLSKSRICELPPELGGLKHLISLDLELCPLEGPIFDIVKNTNNTKTILGFLHSVLEEAVEYNCMNLMFVGVHDIGKTTLLNQIRKNREIPKGAPSPTHWNERRNRNRFASTDSTPLSTVGIDINELIIGRKREHGPVTFRTWDFGGQKEYYATHQYFLSPRSLYLVMWKLTDGEKGVNSMWQWLVNIQARAPGSPVIIVGTHKDVLEARATKRNYTETWEEEMNSLVKEHFINVEEPDKCGLPNIITFMNISCKNRRDTDRLVDLIYDTVFNLKHPKRKSEQILKHKIPKKYILLKEIVQELAVEREKEKKDPVLDKDAYLLKTMNKMFGKSGAMFRDVDDVEQATNFLHENGILFHYEDVGLKDLYFLNPQWLCDQLAQVVAIDQVNNYCRNGIMNASDLRILFKQSTFQPESIERYICGLLAKFEVALEFDRNRLILPSLLPTEMAMPKSIKHKTDVKISVAKPCQNQEVELFSNFPFHASIRTNRFRTKNRLTIDSRMLRTPDGLDSPNSPTLGTIVYIDKPEATKNIMFSLCRLYVMTYFPSGFWPRLITRILADSSLYGIIESLVPIPEEIRELCPMIKKSTPKWQPWQTGIKLVNYGAELFCLKEVLGHESDFCQYKQYYFKCFLEEQWTDIDLEHSVMLEISFPSDSLIFTLAERAESESYVQKRSEQVYLDENVKAKLMTLMTAHIDNLLHDWYPDLGEARFTQNCYGRYLITRIVPCPHCLYEVRMKEMTDGKLEHWQCIVPSKTNKLESADFQSVERPPLVDSEKTEIIYCFVVERSIVNFLRGYNELCKVHGSVSPSHMMSETGVCYTLHTAPDVVFEDIDNDLLIESSSYLSMDRKLGRGSYGDVFAGQLKKGDEPAKDVAIKVLLHSSGSFRTKDYMFMQKACDAYLMARQEVSILADVQHDHIVQIIGLSTHPLALVLDLAPCGALGNILEDLGKEGQLLSVPTIKQVILQVSDALAFLHFKSIIYRDLKADNVLVWKIPVLDNSGYCGPVHVKLADYGISRSVLPSGTKGYGGTAPFIAPEILQYGGKRTYTEKVDIFSFGMFMFELLTCSRPLEEVSNTTLFICQNGRPHITSKEKNYPCHFLDLMCMCWHPDPTKRPSAITIRQISDSAQFTHLSDAVSMDTNAVVFTGCSVPKVHRPTDTDSIGSDIVIVSNDYDVMGTQVWLSTHVPHGSSFIEIFTYNMNMMCTSNQTLPLNSGVEIHAMVAVDTNIWCVDNNSNVIIYSSETTQLISSCVVNTYDHTLVLSGHYIPDSAGGQVVFVFKSLNDNVVVLVKLPVSSHGAVFTSVKISMDSHSHCSCYVHFGRTTEMWIGQDNGKIAVLDLVSVDSKVDAKKPEYKILQHPNAKKKQCTLLVTNKSPSCSSQNSVWSYVYPGSVVQRWSTWNQQVECQLDCSIIAPVTETFELRSPSKSRLSSHNQRYQVTAISVLDKFLYIGTTWGCVIVANALTLQHYTVFKCHSDSDFFVRLILPLFENPGQSPGVKLVAGIVTVGKGYVPLIQLASKQELMDDDEVLSRTARPSSELERNTHVLSWMAKHWDF